MSNAYFHIQEPLNEPYLDYAPGSSEREALKERLKEMKFGLSYFPADFLLTHRYVQLHSLRQSPIHAC